MKGTHTTTHNLNPPLNIARQINFPRTPRELAFRRQIIHINSIPAEPTISTQLDSFRPASSTTVRPAFAVDFAIVNDDLFGPGRHYSGGDGHFLDLDPVGHALVVFADLLVEVEVFLALHWCDARVGADGFDAVEPFDAAGADVACGNINQFNV
jgi:hypothetical protein